MLVLASIIGLYFIVLLRESFAAWELTKAKNANILNVSKHTAVNSGRKIHLNHSMELKWFIVVAFAIQTSWTKISANYFATIIITEKSNSTIHHIESDLWIFRRNQYRCRAWLQSTTIASRRKLPKKSHQRTISAKCVGVLHLARPRNCLVQHFQSGQQHVDVLFQYFGRIRYKIFATHEHIAAWIGSKTFSPAH